MADDLSGTADVQEPQEGAEHSTQPTEQPDTTATEQPTGSSSIEAVIDGLDDAARDLLRGELARRDTDLRKVRNEAKNLRTRLNEATPKAAKHDEVVEAQKSAEQRAQEVANTLKSDNEGLRKRLVAERVRVLAANRFADPDDAAAFLDPSDYLGADLEPDTQAIGDALEDLLTRKPHLGRPDPKPRPPAPSKAQGASGNGAPSVEQQIVAARKAGDHDQAVALELSKLTIHNH